MATCEQCRDWLWEDLYGLLEAGQRESLQAHLMDCNLCRAAQAQAEDDQLALAQAARLDIVIPAFKVPSSDRIPIALRLQDSRTRAKRRRLAWRLTAAAAALFLVLVPFGFYEAGLREHRAALAQAKNEAAQRLAERDQFRHDASTHFKEWTDKLKAGQLCLQVLAPADYVPGGPNPLRIVAADLHGQPASAPLTARLVDANQHEYWRESLVCNGTAALILPANLNLPLGTSAHLELAGTAPEHMEKLQANIAIAAPELLTQLVTDRPVYQPGDRLFFRSLTLERFRLAAPGRELVVVYTVQNAQGGRVAGLSGTTHENGIGGGDLVLPANLMDGEYVLKAESSVGLFPPSIRRFLIRSAGSTPTALPPTPASSWGPLKVDFFPEGGDLLAGVPNRVYFRVRTPHGEADTLTDGMLLDSNDQEVARIATAPPSKQLGLGLGVFTFTPRLGQTYHLSGRSKAGYKASAELPGAGSATVALSVPSAVVQPGDKVLAVLRQLRSGQPLFVALTCRGRLVAQEMVSGQTAETQIELVPPADCAGLLRVTVFDCQPSQPVPIAERLVYRMPDRRLGVSAQPDKAGYRPGERVHLQVSATNEAGQPEQAWLLVSAVNQDALGLVDDPSAGVAAYFHLTAELPQAGELENPNFLTGTSPEALAALELVLGTHGWRRFLEPQALGGLPADAGLLVKQDNLQQVNGKVAAEARLQLAAQDRALTEAGENILQQAQSGLDAYQGRALAYLQIGLGLAALTCLASGGVFLAVGLVRAFRRPGVYRRHLLGAVLSGAACVALALGAWRGGHQPASGSGDTEQLARALEKTWDPAGVGQRAGPLRVAVAGTSRQHLPDQLPSPRSRPNSAAIQHSLPSAGGPSAAPREYVYLLAQDKGTKPQGPATLVWHPVFCAKNGSAEIIFDLPKVPGTFHIQVQGAGGSGRLGTVQQDLVTR